ncbi:MAG: nucleotide exchange factor GrpE [Erysipelotrichaceae bacterium]|nr:nucleotide exchange factor GrpE [Erysipelotrichaceae bacterium]
MAEEKKVNEDINEEVEEVKEDVEVVEEDETAKQIEDLTNQVTKWKTDYYKVFADMENTKKRLQNEHNNQMKFIMQSFIEELLPVLDNFDRSLAQKADNEEIESFLKGYQMIYDQLMAILKKNGVEVIEAQGKEFDPNFHQAVMTANDENYEANIVVEELQKGYMLKGRVIRPTLVKVNQ